MTIKPCPFCGSDQTRVVPDFRPQRDFYVCCFKCSAQGSLGYNEEKAIEIWNKTSKKLELHSWDESPERMGQ